MSTSLKNRLNRLEKNLAVPQQTDQLDTIGLIKIDGRDVTLREGIDCLISFSKEDEA